MHPLEHGDRHVSFASPPVDRTITAASYPSSPESARSPPSYFTQPATPNYRTAFLRDPFEGLGGNSGEDKTIQEALQNAQTNTDVIQVGNIQPQEDAVKHTLGRFAPAQRPSSTPDASTTSVATPAASQRKSLDVEAFKRLLLTGNSAGNDHSTRQNTSTSGDNASSTDTNSISQSSLFDTPGQIAEATPRSSHEAERTPSEGTTKAPPPAPAPRRGKSIKLQDPLERSDAEAKEPVKPPPRAAPAPPVARRSGQNTVSTSEEDVTRKQTGAEARAGTAMSSPKLIPPPPPMRRQHSISQTRLSSDLTPTAEEPGQSQLATSSRRSSADRPPAPPSRNSSASIKRQSMGVIQPPPVPPTRRRDSNRSSMDSFRPSLSSIVGGDGAHEDSLSEPDIRGTRNLTPSSADSILAELANLQKEVDAARGTA